MKRVFSLIAAAAGLAISLPAFALSPGDRVDNFKLLDQTGRMHELYYLSDAKAIAIMVHGNGCPIVRVAMPAFEELRDKYKAQGVEFLLINSNLQDNRASIAKEAKEFDMDIPILVDETQVIGESFEFYRTAEVFIIDPKTWKLIYRGAMDDRVGYETQKFEASNHHVADALDAVLANKAVEVAKTEAKGCLVNLPELERKQEHAKISYSEEVAPILIENCVNCHREGGIGPFAMTEYNMIKGFAPMIREVIRTKRMPPWHADPHIGEFSNDRSLSTEEIQTLVHWIEAGAPRGKGDDTLAQYMSEKEWPEWTLGEPDLIVEIPSFDVPATGVIDYQNPRALNPADEGIWVRAVEILPGARQALHHVITTYGMPNDKHPEGMQTMGGLGGYVPGGFGEEFPEGTGVFLPKGALMNFQMHYTTFGKAVTDSSTLGLYLHKEEPGEELVQRFMLNPRLKIPPHAKEHWETTSWTVDRDLALYTLLPHAHFRGKSANFVAHYPDGRQEVLLSVPNYDFNWQTTYHLKEPKVLPAGTKLVYNGSFDNSAQNPANPDPNREVPWGEQTFDEMLFASMKFRYLEPKRGKSAAAK